MPVASSTPGCFARTATRWLELARWPCVLANITGFKAGPIAQFTQGKGNIGGGISVYYERNLIAGWLEIEPAIAAFWVEDETVVPIEVLLKKPFHANHVVNPYAGLGPELALLFTPHGNRARFGLKFVGGSYFWFREGPWGLDVEIAYVLLFWDKLAERYAKQPIANLASYERKLEVTKSRLLRRDDQDREEQSQRPERDEHHVPPEHPRSGGGVSAGAVRRHLRLQHPAPGRGQRRHADIREAGFVDISTPDVGAKKMVAFVVATR
jgi:hypothetical protein